MFTSFNIFSQHNKSIQTDWSSTQTTEDIKPKKQNYIKTLQKTYDQECYNNLENGRELLTLALMMSRNSSPTLDVSPAAEASTRTKLQRL